MAETKQELIIEINVEGSTEQLAKLRQEMDVLIARRQDLADKSKAGDATAVKETERVSSAIRNLQTEYKAQQRVLDGYTNTIKTNTNTSNLAANSIQQNRDLLKQLTAQYINLKSPSENATAQIKHLSDVLKQQEAAIGNTSRNVGNYGDSFKQAFAEIGLSGNAAFGAIEKGANIVKIGFKLAQDSVSGIKDTFSELKSTVSNVSSTQKAYAAAQTTASAATTGLATAQGNATKIGFKYAQGTATLNEVQVANEAVTAAAVVETEALATAQVAAEEATLATAAATDTLKGALAATGIGAVILAVGALVYIMSSFDSITDAVHDKTEGLKLGFKEFTSELTTSGVSFKQAINNFAEYTKIGEKIAESTRKITSEQEIQDVSNTKLASSENILLIQLKDNNKTVEEKIRLADAFAKKQTENYNAQKAIIDRQVKDAIRIFDIAQETGQGVSEASKHLSELLVKQAEFNGQKNELDEKLSSRHNQIILDGINSEVALLESAAAIQIENGTATANSLITIEKTKTAKLLENTGLTLKEQENLQAQSNVKIQQINEQFQNQRKAAQIKAEEITAERAKLTGQEITGILIDIEKKRRDLLLNNIKLSKQERLNIEKDFENKVSKITLDGANKRVSDIIKAEELLAEEMKRAGVDNTGVLIQIESDRLAQQLFTLEKGSQAYENAVKASEQKVQQIKLDSAKRQSDIQLQAQSIQLQGFENAEAFKIESARKTNTITGQQELESSRAITERRIENEKNKRIALLNNTALNEGEQQNIIAQTSANIEKIKQDQALFEISVEKQKEEDIKTVIGAGFQFVVSGLGMINQAVQDNAAKEIENSKAVNDARQTDLDRQLKAGLISKKEFNKLSEEADRKLADETREQNRKAWEANQAIQITMAIINTAQAVIAQLSNPTPYVGFVLSALAAATGAAQIAIIASQAPPKFAKGVIGLDGNGTDTSDSIPAYLSRGESVLTAKATRKYHRELQWMEQSVGNVPNYTFGKGMFAGGFIPTVEGDGGFVSREIASKSNGLDTAAIVNAVRSIQNPVLSIVELNEKQNSRNRSINVSEA